MKVSLRIIGFILLSIVLFASLFKIYGADLTNNVLGVAVMVLLLSIFSDLKDFNFWGLTGTRLEQQLRSLEAYPTPAVTPKNAPKVTKAAVQQARENTEEVQLTDTGRSNFLELTYAIEKLLRTAAAALLVPESKMNTTQTIAHELQKKGLLTDNGVKQLQAVLDLRNMIIHGKDTDIHPSVIDAGLDLAQNLFSQLQNWLRNPR